MAILDLPLWAIEAPALLCARNTCGNETTLDLGERFLTEDHREAIAERHSEQVGSMLETRAPMD